MKSEADVLYILGNYAFKLNQVPQIYTKINHF